MLFDVPAARFTGFFLTCRISSQYLFFHFHFQFKKIYKSMTFLRVDTCQVGVGHPAVCRSDCKVGVMLRHDLERKRSWMKDRCEQQQTAAIAENRMTGSVSRCQVEVASAVELRSRVQWAKELPCFVEAAPLHQGGAQEQTFQHHGFHFHGLLPHVLATCRCRWASVKRSCAATQGRMQAKTPRHFHEASALSVL
jgi:hypothetical protein